LNDRKAAGGVDYQCMMKTGGEDQIHQAIPACRVVVTRAVKGIWVQGGKDGVEISSKDYMESSLEGLEGTAEDPSWKKGEGSHEEPKLSGFGGQGGWQMGEGGKRVEVQEKKERVGSSSRIKRNVLVLAKMASSSKRPLKLCERAEGGGIGKAMHTSTQIEDDIGTSCSRKRKSIRENGINEGQAKGFPKKARPLA